ncbi:hypothetical protein EYF80_048283 [Liparis tanakae]|uniref:Uncharacterized protein n=1 Tax=Liparis tanakae TaxID=230148 RepID=A0A4Z2FML7_9TELE|nr:hypothetical protein EYF80_048283 [Liparis tanakae]
MAGGIRHSQVHGPDESHKDSMFDNPRRKGEVMRLKGYRLKQLSTASNRGGHNHRQQASAQLEDAGRAALPNAELAPEQLLRPQAPESATGRAAQPALHQLWISAGLAFPSARHDSTLIWEISGDPGGISVTQSPSTSHNRQFNSMSTFLRIPEM